MKNQPVGSNKKLTIGFLDENSYYDYHNLIISGIYKAARKYRVNLIRFSHFTGRVIARNAFHEPGTHKNVFLECTKQFRLDGLIILGWARSLDGLDLRSVFGDMPLFSLGMENKGIPSAYFPGDHYIREILLHLIHTHHYTKIAFAKPSWPDIRADFHVKVMKSLGVFDPVFLLEESDLWGLDFHDRGIRSVQILLDERRVKPDVIIAIDSDEAYSIFTELRRRGLRVPEDIALVCYEDGENGRFSMPAFTSFYFPWKELGYFSCESLFRMISGERVPMLSKVHGRILYRGSCGCIPEQVKLSGAGELRAAAKCFEALGGGEWKDILGEIAKETAFKYSDIDRLMTKFRQGFLKRENTVFLTEMEYLLRKVRPGGRNREVFAVASTLRRVLLPYFLPYFAEASDKLIWAEDLFFQVQVLLQDKLATACFRDEVDKKNIRLKLKEIGQILIANFTVAKLLDSLEINLPKLKIKSCQLYFFEKDGNAVNLEKSRLAFGYSGFERMGTAEAQGMSISESLETLLRGEEPRFLTAHLLHNGDDFAGLVLFEPENMDMGIYQSMATQISTALNGIMLFDKLDSGYRRLMDQAHKKGMADISTGILHNIGNILNTIAVTAQSTARLLEESPIEDLLMANALLENNMDTLDDFIRNDPKGRMLMQFYVSLKDSFETFRAKLQENVGRLSDRITLIDEIITAQQTYTGVKSNLKALDLGVVIDDVLKIHRTSIERHGIQVGTKTGRAVKALANRTKLFHVLANIIKNATEAMENTPRQEKKLVITVSADGDKAYIRIRDTGGGIEQGHLEDIFAYGFTTKAGGHGFGLHSCANYMTEMGGRLWAESGGPGTGAEFVMQLRKAEEAAGRDYEV